MVRKEPSPFNQKPQFSSTFISIKHLNPVNESNTKDWRESASRSNFSNQSQPVLCRLVVDNLRIENQQAFPFENFPESLVQKLHQTSHIYHAKIFHARIICMIFAWKLFVQMIFAWFSHYFCMKIYCHAKIMLSTLVLKSC